VNSPQSRKLQKCQRPCTKFRPSRRHSINKTSPGDGPGFARPGQEDVIRVLCPSPHHSGMLARYAPAPAPRSTYCRTKMVEKARTRLRGCVRSSDAPRGRAKHNGLCVRSLGLTAGACAAIVAAYYMTKSRSAKEHGVGAEGKRKESWRDQLSVGSAIFLSVPAFVSGCLPVLLDENLSQCLCTQCLSAWGAYSHVYVYHYPHAAELGRPKL
jgi:hypothetical protein